MENMEKSFAQHLYPVDIEQEMKKSFISYAMAVNISRALPDVRDGLKPVHRRILYSMYEMSLFSDKPYRKCARIVGDVLGKYHPHGDTAVYDALVRLAQDFSICCPLVDGHGNFGSVDGDSAAAMRYTEARMSKIAYEMLRDLDKETVDMYPNFDESLMQPKVLPSRFPNILVNGADGIAVGMATNIPPHNLGEAIDAAVALIDNPDTDVDGLMEYIQGPDFPTGGLIMGVNGIRSAYRTGRGKVVVRAKTEIEEYKPGYSRIIVTEIPYQVNKALLVEKIADLYKEKKFEGLADLRDESDRSGMRIVIELKKDVNPNVVLNFLFKHTRLQETFGVIMLALVDGAPQMLDLRSMLVEYLKHQKDVVTRRTQYDLNKCLERSHILEGLLIALDHIDEVIALIKASANAEVAKLGLMERFGLTERQAKAILEMRLQRLTGLEREKLENEYAQLQEQIAYFRQLLADEKLLMGVVRDEMLEIKAKYAQPRKSEITFSEDDIDIEDLIDQHDIVVTLTHFGYVKRMPTDLYRAQRRGGKGITALTTRQEDVIQRMVIANTHTKMLFFTNKAKVFALKGYQIPEAGRQAKGTAAINLLNLEPEESVKTLIALPDEFNGNLVFITRGGIVKKTKISEFDHIRKTGIIALGLKEGDELAAVVLTNGEDELIIGTRKGKAIRFSEQDIRPMGRTACGVIGIDIADDDMVVNMSVAEENKTVMTITEKGYGKRTPLDEYRLQSRGGKGVITHDLTDKTGDMVDLRLVREDQDLMMINDDSTVIRIPVEGIRPMSRSTQGVRVMRLNDEAKIVSVTEIDAEDKEDEAPETTESGE